MFATIEDVYALTPYASADIEDFFVDYAQAIIEAYIGRSEARVEDPDDLELLRKATIFQTVYMNENWHSVFEQVGASRISQDNFTIDLVDETSPYIAPLAKMVCSRLSWFRSRSITTAPTFPNRVTLRWEEV